MISIIIPIYNAEKYIRQCIDSIVIQNVEKEIICVDDGSTDNSKSIIEEYAINHTNILVISQQNLGAPAARNNGFIHASGEYCVFFDADDVMEKGALETMIEVVTMFDADLVVGGYTEIDAGNEIINQISMKRFDVNNKWKYALLPPLPGNKLYKRELITQNSLLFENVKIGQDLNFYLKFVLVCKRPVVVNENVLNYRIVDGSISRTWSMNILDICTSIDDVKQFYKNHSCLDQFNKYVSMVELSSYRVQLEKIRHFDYEDKKIIKKVLKERVSNCQMPTIRYWFRYFKERFIILKLLIK